MGPPEREAGGFGGSGGQTSITVTHYDALGADDATTGTVTDSCEGCAVIPRSG